MAENHQVSQKKTLVKQTAVTMESKEIVPGRGEPLSGAAAKATGPTNINGVTSNTYNECEPRPTSASGDPRPTPLQTIQAAISEMLKNIRNSGQDKNDSPATEDTGNVVNVSFLPSVASLMSQARLGGSNGNNNCGNDARGTSPGQGEKVNEEKGVKIKRPMNAFMVWAREYRNVLAKGFPTDSNSQISVRLGDIWSNLSNEEKQPFYDKADILRRQHEKDYPDWVYQPNKKKRGNGSPPNQSQCTVTTPTNVAGSRPTKNVRILPKPPPGLTQAAGTPPNQMHMRGHGQPMMSSQYAELGNTPRPIQDKGPYYASPKRQANPRKVPEASPLAADKFQNLLTQHPLNNVIRELSPGPKKCDLPPPKKKTQTSVKSKPHRPRSTRSKKHSPRSSKAKKTSPDKGQEVPTAYVHPSWSCMGGPYGSMPTVMYSPYPTAAANMQVRSNTPIVQNGQSLVQLPTPANFIVPNQVGPVAQQHMGPPMGSMLTPAVPVVGHYPTNLRPDYSHPPPPLMLPPQPGVVMYSPQRVYSAASVQATRHDSQLSQQGMVQFCNNNSNNVNYNNNATNHANVTGNSNGGNVSGNYMQTLQQNVPSVNGTDCSLGGSLVGDHNSLTDNKVVSGEYSDHNARIANPPVLHMDQANSAKSNNEAQERYAINFYNSRGPNQGDVNRGEPVMGQVNARPVQGTASSFDPPQNLQVNSAQRAFPGNQHNPLMVENFGTSSIPAHNPPVDPVNARPAQGTASNFNPPQKLQVNSNQRAIPGNQHNPLLVQNVGTPSIPAQNPPVDPPKRVMHQNKCDNFVYAAWQQNYPTQVGAPGSSNEFQQNPPEETAQRECAGMSSNKSFPVLEQRRPDPLVEQEAATNSRNRPVNNTQPVGKEITAGEVQINVTKQQQYPTMQGKDQENLQTHLSQQEFILIGDTYYQVVRQQPSSRMQNQVTSSLQQNPHATQIQRQVVMDHNNDDGHGVGQQSQNMMQDATATAKMGQINGSQMDIQDMQNDGSNFHISKRLNHNVESNNIPTSLNTQAVYAPRNVPEPSSDNDVEDERQLNFEGNRPKITLTDAESMLPDIQAQDTVMTVEVITDNNSEMAPLPRNKSFLQTLQTPLSNREAADQLTKLMHPPPNPHALVKQNAHVITTTDESNISPSDYIVTAMAESDIRPSGEQFHVLERNEESEREQAVQKELEAQQSHVQNQEVLLQNQEVFVQNQEVFVLDRPVSEEGSNVRNQDKDITFMQLSNYSQPMYAGPVTSTPNKGNTAVIVNDSYSPQFMAKNAVPEKMFQTPPGSSGCSDESLPLDDGQKLIDLLTASADPESAQEPEKNGMSQKNKVDSSRGSNESLQLKHSQTPIDLSIVSADPDSSEMPEGQGKLPTSCGTFLIDLQTKEILVRTEGWDVKKCEQMSQGQNLGDQKTLVQLKKNHERLLRYQRDSCE